MSNIVDLAEVRELFERRTGEVRRYFDFLTAITDSKADAIGTTQSDGSMKRVADFELSRDLIKTLRANGYLLLYNLVESTMTNAVDSIHQYFLAENIGFDDLRAEVQQVILKQFRNASIENNLTVTGSHPIQLAILRTGYDKRNLFSGNVDAKNIRDTAKIYGFNIADHDISASRDGTRLLNVKNKRNELAHGKISFEECGHEIPHDEIVAIASETITYLAAVITGIETYIKDRAYLARRRNVS